MSEVAVVSDKLVDERIALYLQEHQDEIVEMIDKKIAINVKSAVNDAFRSGWRTESNAEKRVKQEVDQIIDMRISEIKIDEESIKEAVDKKVKNYLRRASVNVEVN